MSHKGTITIDWVYIYSGRPSQAVREQLDADALEHAAGAIRRGWTKGDLFRCGLDKHEYRGYWKLVPPKAKPKKKKARRCVHCGATKPYYEECRWVDSGHGTVSCGGPDCVVF